MSKWVFYDPVTVETYTFEISVSQGDNRSLSRSPVGQTSVGYLNSPVVIGGGVEPRQEEASGTVITEAQYTALLSWCERDRVIQLTDHLGRTNNILITEFAPTRTWKTNDPWYHTYSLKYLVVG